MKRVNFSVCASAYNEEDNIEKFIKSVYNQSLPPHIKMKEMLIVASGCTDNTIPIIKSLKKKHKSIRLIIQKERKGKVSAVNVMLNEAKAKLMIFQSTDTLPAKSCYKYLLQTLVEEDVGLVAGQIKPKDDKNTFCGFANHFRWKLHHEINLAYPQRPKVGELIAFKKIFERIPPKTVVDEASVEPLIHLQGYKIKYITKAIIYNQGPKTIREYLSRRRSIHAGHYITKKKYAYEVVTFSGNRIIPIFIKNLEPNLKFLSYALFTVILESISRLFGFLDVKFKLRDQVIWKIATTTKKL